MQRTAFINGSGIAYDKDYSLTARTIITPWVIEGLEVQNGKVTPGIAFIEVTRTATTPQEKVYVIFENTTEIDINTTGTKKIFVKVPQENINDPMYNQSSEDIATIETAEEYPSENYLPLASITTWTISDERPEIEIKGKIRRDLPINTIVYVNAEGDESFVQFNPEDDDGKTLIIDEVNWLRFESATADIGNLEEDEEGDIDADFFLRWRQGEGNKKIKAKRYLATNNEILSGEEKKIPSAKQVATTVMPNDTIITSWGDTSTTTSSSSYQKRWEFTIKKPWTYRINWQTISTAWGGGQYTIWVAIYKNGTLHQEQSHWWYDGGRIAEINTNISFVVWDTVEVYIKVTNNRDCRLNHFSVRWSIFPTEFLPENTF